MTEEEATTPPPTWTLDQWADYWRYNIGVNVIAANTRDKKPLKGISWEQWQNNPIPEELHNQWKKQVHFQKELQ
jgi:hypothetical protein